MGFMDAAITVLRQSGQSLHYVELTRHAINAGLLVTAGRTPERTMNAAISTSLVTGKSPFVRAGRGLYGLAEWAAQPMEVLAPLPVPSPTPAPRPHKTYRNYKDAAQKVLSALGQPAHYKQITRLALEKGYINPEGLTPEATMGAQLYTDVKRKGAASAFRREDRGVFGLAVWEKEVSGITRLAARQREAVKKQLLDHLLSMDSADFERLAARLLGAMGYEDIAVTRRSGDGGVDVLASIQVGILQLRTAVQVKRMRSNIQRPVVSQLRGDMMTLPDVDQGMIITTSGFSSGAEEVARVRNAPLIVLIDGDRLTDLLIEHEIGVRVEPVEVVAFDEERLWAEGEG